MVQSYLWGPQLWEALFACAFHCKRETSDEFSSMIHYHLGLLLLISLSAFALHFS